MNEQSKKRKITQNDLRMLMLEKKRKLTETKRKIDSPLAKYSDDGTLTCIICNSIVKSEAIWHTHLISKEHRDNIARKKQSREKFTVETPKLTVVEKKEPKVEIPNPPVKLKGILKNKQVENIVNVSPFVNNVTPSMEVSSQDTSNQMEVDADMETVTNELPEGFFDDPIMDAKARNIDYKDPIEEELERFKKEIEEENLLSEQILDEDQEIAATEKEIAFIDEDIQHWSRMRALEEKIENVRKKTLERKNTIDTPMPNSNDDADSSYGSEEEFDEYIDWRSKRSFK